MSVYEVIGPVTDRAPYGQPPDPGCDYARVEADTASEARWAAMKLPEFQHHRDDMRSDGTHPLTGVSVLKLPECLLECDGC